MKSRIENDIKVVFKRTDQCALPLQEFENAKEGLLTCYYSSIAAANADILAKYQQGFKILGYYLHNGKHWVLFDKHLDYWDEKGYLFYSGLK